MVARTPHSKPRAWETSIYLTARRPGRHRPGRVTSSLTLFATSHNSLQNNTITVCGSCRSSIARNWTFLQPTTFLFRPSSCKPTRVLYAGAVGAALPGTGHFYSQLRFGSVPAPANQHQYPRYVRYVGPEGPHHLAARLPRQANRFENKIKSASCATRGCYAVVIYRPKGQRCQHSEDLQAQNHSSIVYIKVKSKTVSTSCPFLNKKFVLYRSLVSACRSTKGKSQSRDCVD